MYTGLKISGNLNKYSLAEIEPGCLFVGKTKVVTGVLYHSATERITVLRGSSSIYGREKIYYSSKQAV